MSPFLHDQAHPPSGGMMTTALAKQHAAIVSLGDEQVRQTTLAWLIGQRSDHTRRAYTRALAMWIAWCRNHDLDPVNPSRAEVQVWVADMAASYAAKSVQLYHTGVRSWHNELAAAGARPSIDVHHKISRPRARRRVTPRLLPDAEVRALVHAAKEVTEPAEVAILMMATMGMRAGEVCSVKGSMIESSPYGPMLRFTGKGNEVALVPAPRVVIEAAERTGWPGDNLDGLTYDAAYKRLGHWTSRAAKRAEVAGFHPHLLRHWYVSRALEEGVDPMIVQASARHASFDTTMGYARNVDTLRKHATFTVADVFERTLAPDWEPAPPVPRHKPAPRRGRRKLRVRVVEKVKVVKQVKVVEKIVRVEVPVPVRVEVPVPVPVTPASPEPQPEPPTCAPPTFRRTGPPLRPLWRASGH